jgi:glyoxylase-like metal-dependent hydrolase (beta-lactamase superfamily II)
MESWTFGSVEITRVVDTIATLPASGLITEATPEALVDDHDWLCPHFLDTSGNMFLSIHTFAVRTPAMALIVDTCLGEQEESPGPLAGSGNFLDLLVEAGFPPDTVDRVLCTHLHFDHIGWNTRLENGQWVPTFPNARYLMGRSEWDFWKDEEDAFAPNAKNESVVPILDAGLADLVEVDHRISEEISLIPTPGHTPGHVSVLIESGGETAVITGDMLHHPLQIAHPEWIDIADVDSGLAQETRERFIRTYADTAVTILGTHFAAPTAGKICTHGDTYRFEI